MPEVQVDLDLAQQRHGMTALTCGTGYGMKKGRPIGRPFVVFGSRTYGAGAVCSVGAGSGVLTGVLPA